MRLLELLDTPPTTGVALRRSVQAGAILLVAPSAASLRATARALLLVEEQLGPQPRCAHLRQEPAALFSRVTEARRRLGEDPPLRALLGAVAEELGLGEKSLRLDPPRLRAVAPGLDRLPEAAPALYAHRDTWYANPPSQLNLWLPLHEVEAAETLRIYPTLFGVPVDNDSEGFDYARFVREVGWQRPGGAALGHYPRARGALPEEESVGVAAPAGARLLFSAAQLHRTLPHDRDRLRLSLDVRLQHAIDHARGLGAPDPDNRSKGSTFADARPL